jgi:hypothetical protein
LHKSSRFVQGGTKKTAHSYIQCAVFNKITCY